MTCKRRKFRR